MTIANTTTKQTYNGNGVTVNFPIPFALFEKDVVKVFLIDTTVADPSTPSGYSETTQVESTHFNFDANPPTQVQMLVAPTADEQLRISRLSDHTQPANLIPGQDNADAIENQLDRITMQIQEHHDDIEVLQAGGSGVVVAASGSFPDWGTGINYLQYQVVIRNGRQYRVTVDHLSNVFSTDLLDGKLEELQYVGIQGPQGEKGDDGADGADGADSIVPGPQGAPGVDGIFSQIASQAEAEAGVENTKGMTPLRVAQAITAQVDPDRIGVNEASIATLISSVNALSSRVTTLENLVQQATGKFSGQQVLLNNSGPIELLGAETDPPNNLNCGTRFERSSVGTEFAKVMVGIKRVTDAGIRVSSFDLVMQHVNGTWFIGREDTTQLDQTLDLDGVILSVNTVAGVGLVSYTTNLMAGAGHDNESIIYWLGQEISIC